MSITRLQLDGPVRLSEFAAESGCSGHEIEHGRMPLSRLAQHWGEQESADKSKDEQSYKPYVRNRYKHRRVNQTRLSDINPI